MDITTERKRAGSAYQWLRVSPLATITTLFIIFNLDIGSWIFQSSGFQYSNNAMYINLFFGIVVSALWHLNLLRFVNDTESQFVRKHGRLAIKRAAIRTSVPLFMLALDFALNSSGAMACFAIVLLIIFWAGDTKNGLSDIDNELGKDDQVDFLMQPEVGETPIDQPATVAHTESPMAENQNITPEEMLAAILKDLQSDDEKLVLETVAKLHQIKFSSVAIRRELESLALQSKSNQLRKAALDALNIPLLRNVASRINKIDKSQRRVILDEIKNWEKDGLMEDARAELIRRRYDFDIASPAAKPAPTPPAAMPTRQASVPAETKAAETPAAIPVERAVPPQLPKPAAPRPSLLQTLTSETSIKIYLYLGAFFVIASAVILGVAVPELRLPILVIATLIFGGFSIAIKKRLPQPSFALFIVFSFLLPITANTVLVALRESMDISLQFSAGYWSAIYFIMALIWSGSTWLYESKLFSITAFIALAFSFLRFGGVFDAKPEFYTIMSGLVSLAGLGGSYILRQWKDNKFALPLFITTQLAQGITLLASISIFGANLLDPSTQLLWHLGTLLTWVLALVFYILSESLWPFILFPWLAGAILVPMPWFIGAAFDLESLGSTILLFSWGAITSIVCEVIHRFELNRKYSLPILLASIPAFGLSIISGFGNGYILASVTAFAIAIIYTVLHILRTRWWLWTMALISFVISYVAFLNIDAIDNLSIFFGYEILVLSLLFLLPDLFLKSDIKDNLAWRLPPRLFGILFTALNFLLLPLINETPFINTAIIFLIYAIFFAVYAVRYNQAWIGYTSTSALALFAIHLLKHFDIDQWVATLSILGTLYFLGGLSLRKRETLSAWRTMFEASGLILGSMTSIAALLEAKEYSGWFMALIGILFIIEMYIRKNDYFEAGTQILFPAAAAMILHDFKVTEAPATLLAITLVILTLDIIFFRTYKPARLLNIPVKIIGGIIALTATVLYLDEPAQNASIGFWIFSAFFIIYAILQQKANWGYLPAAYLPLAILPTLDLIKLSEYWLPTLTALSVLYFTIGMLIRNFEKWSLILRNSSLTLGTIISFVALFSLETAGGWYPIVIGILFAVEMYLRRNGLFEFGLPAMFNISVYLILRHFNIDETTYHLLAYSIVWLLTDLLAQLTFTDPRPLKWPVRIIGIALSVVNIFILFNVGLNVDNNIAVIGYSVYSALCLTFSLVYQQPNLLYAFTSIFALFIGFVSHSLGIDKWTHPVIGIAVLYYAIGYIFRKTNRYPSWEIPLLYSGLSLGVIVSIASPAIGKLDAAIPIALAATLWAVEAFARKNVWLAFPANGLYLFAYFIILIKLDVSEPQFFSIGAALLGLIQHYLLVRAESKSGAFIMGMVSQFVLLGTTYIELINKNDLNYFFALFIQSLIVLVYGIVIRSRSLTFFPIGFVILGVITVTYSALKNVATIFLIGCTGIFLLLLGISAVLLRERIVKLSERLSDWSA